MSAKRPFKASPFTPEFNAQPKPYRPQLRVAEDEFYALPPDVRKKFDRVDDLDGTWLFQCEQDAVALRSLIEHVPPFQRVEGVRLFLSIPSPRHRTVDDDGIRYVSAKNNTDILCGSLEVQILPQSVSFADDVFGATAEALRRIATQLEAAAQAVEKAKGQFHV